MSRQDKQRAARAADNERTADLLDAMDQAFGADRSPSPAPGTFEGVLQAGLMSDTCGWHPYPPTGHSYPTD